MNPLLDTETKRELRLRLGRKLRLAWVVAAIGWAAFVVVVAMK